MSYTEQRLCNIEIQCLHNKNNNKIMSNNKIWSDIIHLFFVTDVNCSHVKIDRNTCFINVPILDIYLEKRSYHQVENKKF